MRFSSFCLVFAACFAVCYSRDIYVNSTTELQNAMKGVLPGDKITVGPGIYQIQNSPWGITAAGTSDKPIQLVCALSGSCDIRSAIVVAGSSYSTISGFTIGLPHAFDAVTVQDCDHISLNNLRLHDGDDNNLWIVRTFSSSIRYCSFEQTAQAILVRHSSDITINQCTFGDAITDGVLLVDNTTKVEFSSNNVYGTQNCYSGGSWIVERDAGGNMIADNNFGWVFSKYQKHLNGYWAKGSPVFGPSTLKNNFMDLKDGVGFGGCKTYKNRVCASNVVAGGAAFTDGDIDKTC